MINFLFSYSAQGGVLPYIRAELLRKKTKGDEDNTDSVESQGGYTNSSYDDGATQWFDG